MNAGRILTMLLRPGGPAALVASTLALALPLPLALAGAELLCTYNPDSKRVVVEVPPVVPTISIGRNGDGIVVSPDVDCGAATRFNTPNHRVGRCRSRT